MVDLITYSLIIGGIGGMNCSHKVLTYIEYRAVYGVFRTIDPHPLSLRSARGGGSIVRKTPDIGLASYSIIPLLLPTEGKGYLAVGSLLPEIQRRKFTYNKHWENM
jgi:hypothetical protein